MTVRSWTDEEPLPSGYYRIVALDKAPAEVYAGDRFIQLMDTIPPDAPSGLACTINENGQVTISWDPIEDNSLKGYRVFAGNGMESIFGEQTSVPVTDTFFHFNTTLNTLTESLYLRLQAIDLRENYSEYSEICQATRPDLIPPDRPVLLKANPLVEGIMLEWLHSTSDDVDRHELQRKRFDGTGWETLLELDSEADPVGTPEGLDILNIITSGGKALDTLAEYPQKYEYRILSYDEGDNVASSDILYVQPYDDGVRGTITNATVDSTFEVTYDRGVNILEWNYDNLEGLFDFQIYRSVDGKPMTAYATTNGRGGLNFANSSSPSGLSTVTSGIFSWKDITLGTAKTMANSGIPGVNPNGPRQRTFKYQIMARHFDGGSSPISEVIEISAWVPSN